MKDLLIIIFVILFLWAYQYVSLPSTPGTYVLHYDGKRYKPVPFDKAFKDMAEGLREKTLREEK